jgi:hypothetical protein
MDYFVARRIRRVVIAVVVLAAAGWVWHTFYRHDLPLPALPKIPGVAERDADAGPGADASAPGAAQANPPLYKWKDADGRWNITDRPPPDRPYEKVVVDPDTNVIPSLAPPAEERESDAP